MSHSYRDITYTAPDGMSLFCREYAPANPRGTVVCLPGLTRNSRDFVTVAKRIAETYRVLTPDLRGRGNSQWDPKPANYHPTVYYQDVIKLLTEEAPGQRVAIIGTSLGGILAMGLAAHAPERIAGIVVNDVGPELAQEGVARIAGYVGVRSAPGSWSEAAAQVRENYSNAYPDFNDADWLTYSKALYREREDGTIVVDYDPAIGDAMRAQAGRPFDLWPVWAMIRAPVLIVRGARSDLLSVATYDRMLQEKPGLVRIEVPNRGHVPLLTEPGVPEAIEEFLAGLFA